MRIAGMLRASFVGTLLFTPAMAQEVEQIHEEALRVLRETLAQGARTGGQVPAAVQGDAELARQRGEREARIRAEAQQRMAERELQQQQRRVQFEQFVKEREQLRREQRAYDQNAAREMGLVREPQYNEVHTRALEVLRQVPTQGNEATPVEPSAPVFQPAPATENVAAPAASMEVIREPQVAAPAGAAAGNLSESAAAPNVAVQTSALSSSQVDSSDVHQRALEVLRGGRTAVASPEPTPAPTPSPELQQRLKQMQAELEQEQLQRRGATGSAISGDYVKDLERRAQEMVGAGLTSPVVTSGTGLDSETRAIIQRQNQQISSQLGGASAPVTPAPVTPAPVAPVYDTPAVSVTTSAPVISTPGVTHSTVTDSTRVEYSRELEERARQILLERAQAQQSAGAVSSTTITPPPTTAPVEEVVRRPQPAVPPVTASPQFAAPVPNASPDVHSQALRTLNQVQSGGAEAVSAPRTKMQRLKELTDLYRADKMGPAEYHQKRAQILAEPQ
jgi:hypothetical protein